MGEDDKKRRLTLMPEVLPLPTQLSPPKEDGVEAAPVRAAGGARARTLDHMKRLLAGATTSIALAGCSSPDGATSATATAEQKASGSARTSATAAQTETTASSTATAAQTAGDGDRPPTSSASASASGIATTTAPPPTRPTGYMVVDPVPPPPIRKK